MRYWHPTDEPRDDGAPYRVSVANRGRWARRSPRGTLAGALRAGRPEYIPVFAHPVAGAADIDDEVVARRATDEHHRPGSGDELRRAA